LQHGNKFGRIDIVIYIARPDPRYRNSIASASPSVPSAARPELGRDVGGESRRPEELILDRDEVIGRPAGVNRAKKK
jgi:hypothetical protein